MALESQKTDQIAHRLYTKLTLVVNHARATNEPSSPGKVDKWFNIETPDVDLFKDQTKLYRSISTLLHPPAFQLQVLLCVPELAPNQVLAYIAPDSSRSPVDPTPRYILLESWDIAFALQPIHSRAPRDQADVTPPTVYKHGISLFRSVYTLLHILPTWKLARRLRRRAGGNRNGNFGIELRVEGMQEAGVADDILGFDTSVNNSLLPHDVHEFPPVPHPMGTLSLSVTYLKSPQFEIVARESLLSSRFFSQDEGPDFTPTLRKNAQRDSFASSPSSGAARTSVPHSPPSSIADRFVLPPTTHTRTNSVTRRSPRMNNVPLPMTRAVSGNDGTTGSMSGMSDASSIRHGHVSSVGSREELVPSALAARLRKESLGMGRGDPSGARPLPIRRPALNPVNPFKSSTLSSGSPSLHSPSPSLRTQSPLTGGTGPSLPARPNLSSPTASRGPVPPSPVIGSGGRLPSPSLGTPLRPSPPGPSALGDKRTSISAEAGTPVETPPKTPGKRYSSSFSHRYAASVSGTPSAEASPRTGPAPLEKVAGASYFSTNTDDDDISAFVQDIDARKPLSSLREQSSQGSIGVEVEAPSPITETESPARSRTLTGHEPMLTTVSAVDERLKKMNEDFLASLQGLGGNRRERSNHERDSSSTGSSTARAPSSATMSGGSRRALDPIELARRHDSTPPLSRRSSATSGHGIAISHTPGYVRPRFASTGSTRSGFSIASEEVLGRMDPEFDDERRQQPRTRDYPP